MRPDPWPWEPEYQRREEELRRRDARRELLWRTYALPALAWAAYLLAVWGASMLARGC